MRRNDAVYNKEHTFHPKTPICIYGRNFTAVQVDDAAALHQVFARSHENITSSQLDDISLWVEVPFEECQAQGIKHPTYAPKHSQRGLDAPWPCRT